MIYRILVILLHRERSTLAVATIGRRLHLGKTGGRNLPRRYSGHYHPRTHSATTITGITSTDATGGSSRRLFLLQPLGCPHEQHLVIGIVRVFF